MTNASSDENVAQFEDALSQVIVATWNRVRSSNELQEFLDRRFSALSDIEL